MGVSLIIDGGSADILYQHMANETAIEVS